MNPKPKSKTSLFSVSCSCVFLKRWDFYFASVSFDMSKFHENWISLYMYVLCCGTFPSKQNLFILIPSSSKLIRQYFVCWYKSEWREDDDVYSENIEQQRNSLNKIFSIIFFWRIWSCVRCKLLYVSDKEMNAVWTEYLHAHLLYFLFSYFSHVFHITPTRKTCCCYCSSSNGRGSHSV